MRPNRRAQDRDEAQPVAPASYLDAPHSEKVFCKIKDMNNANAATAERNLPSCILETLKREGRLSPSLANVCWLGGLDSNQDSQIQRRAIRVTILYKMLGCSGTGPILTPFLL